MRPVKNYAIFGILLMFSSYLVSCVQTPAPMVKEKEHEKVEILDTERRGHLDTELTMSDYLAFAERVTNRMLVSPLVRSWGENRPRLIVGDLDNNTDNENIRMRDLHDRIQETIFNSGLVRVLDKSATEFEYIVKTELTSTRQYGKDGEELAIFTLQMKMFKLDGELVGQWSDDLGLGKAKRKIF